MKKAFEIIRGTIIVLAVILIGFFALLFVPQMINDAYLPSFRKEVIENLTLPEGSEMVEYVSSCGNSSGTGDHTDLYVAILIKSSLDEDTIKEYYKDDEHYWRTWNTARLDTTKTFGMVCMNLEFEADIDKIEGYYILEYCKSAPLSWFDIRGC